MREVGGGNALVDPALQELEDLLTLGVRELRCEEGLEPIERQVQRMEQQVRRLVVRVGRSVAERELRFAEARHRVAQPIAQRLEVVRERVHRPPVARSGSSNRSRMPR